MGGDERTCSLSRSLCHVSYERKHMTQVTPLNTSRELAARIFPQESILYFPVVERPDGWLDKHGVWHKNDANKHLVRMIGEVPHSMSVVGSGYKNVLARELFPAIQLELVQAVKPEYLRDVQVRDKMAYNGRECFREYLFPNMQCKLRETSVAFRIITWLSYGRGAIRMIAGAVDFACDNGIVTGQTEKHARKHTSGLSIDGITRWIKGMIDIFWTNADTWRKWQGMQVSKTQWQDIADQLVKTGAISEQRRRWLDVRIQIEAQERNNSSLWEVYSALTNWASHSDIRNTGNDHAAMTRVTRETEATRLMHNVVRLYEKDAAA